MKKNLIIAWAALLPLGSAVQAQQASVSEKEITLTSYPFGDPDPVVRPDNPVYPYFRFDGFATEGKPRAWKAVELENDYIRVTLFPEVGGKVWGAVEKSTGLEFIYYNHVAKFRDIAMRGAWTSGGIEFNFGIIGHAPTTATPVDYAVRKNADGSASCFLASYDLLTRTRWSVEVRLPADGAYFNTVTRWHNGSELDQPYYQWMNAAFRASDDAVFCYPGNAAVAHDGTTQPYPVDADGNDLSTYAGNNFDDSKSYHIFGHQGDYHGIYWPRDGFGSVHHAPADEKLGMKIFLWSQARDGGIWEQLLTDRDGQYIELQSGRMYNQPAAQSAQTPFTHAAFAPQSTDEWTEYWFPVRGTGGYVKASPAGALNVIREGGWLKIRFSPVTALETTVRISDGERERTLTPLSAAPLQCWSDSVPLAEAPAAGTLRVTVGDDLLVYSERTEDREIGRPTQRPADFDPESAYAHYQNGEQWLNQKRYRNAERELRVALEKDPCLRPALVRMASLAYRLARYEEALQLSRKALALNTYDGEANYLYGLANRALGHRTDAKDGFSVAAYTPAVRAAAYVSLARLAAEQDDWHETERCARKALTTNASDTDARQLLILAARRKNDRETARRLAEEEIERDPLNHLARYEYYRTDSSQLSRNEFAALIRNELPHETYLELAAWYEKAGCFDEASDLLSLASASPVALYKRGYLLRQQGETDAARLLLKKADLLSPAQVFPFRPETLPALRWARSESASWKPAYYEALLLMALQNDSAALVLLNECNEADYAPLFLTRASLQSGAARLADLQTAEKRGDAWRTGKALADYYLALGDSAKSYETARRYHKRYPDNLVIGLLYAKTLCETGRFEACIEFLKRLDVQPNEGAYAARGIYRKACLNQAVNSWRANRPKAALQAAFDARVWIENLGVGRPYEKHIDERIENYIEARLRAGREPERTADLLQRVAERYPSHRGFRPADLLTAIALRETGREAEAAQRVAGWATNAADPAAAWAAAVYRGDRRQAETLRTQLNLKGDAGGELAVIVRIPDLFGSGR